MERLDTVDAAKLAAVEAFARAIEATAQYAVELMPQEADAFREQLGALAREVKGADGPEQYSVAENALEFQLRAYQQDSHRELQRLRGELDAAAEVLKTFAEGLAASGEEHAIRLDTELKRMEEAAREDDLEHLRQAVRGGVQAVRHSYQELEQKYTRVVAQLKDEIRVLHQQACGQRTEDTESLGLRSRSKTDAMIENLLVRDVAFAVVLVKIEGLGELYDAHPRVAVRDALQHTVKKLAGMIRGRAFMGQWTPGIFAAVLEELPGQGPELARRVPRDLAQPYPCRDHGRPHTLALRAGAALVSRPAGIPAAQFYATLEQAFAAPGPLSV